MAPFARRNGRGADGELPGSRTDLRAPVPAGAVEIWRRAHRAVIHAGSGGRVSGTLAGSTTPVHDAVHGRVLRSSGAGQGRCPQTILPLGAPTFDDAVD